MKREYLGTIYLSFKWKLSQSHSFLENIHQYKTYIDGKVGLLSFQALTQRIYRSLLGFLTCVSLNIVS